MKEKKKQKERRGLKKRKKEERGQREKEKENDAGFEPLGEKC